MKKMTFETKLIATGPNGAWTIMDVPFNVHEAFGTRGRLPVVGTMNGFPFRNSVMPEGDGTHRMMVSKKLRAGANASPGDIVKVTLQRDEKERPVEMPVELQSALKKSKPAATFFAGLAPSHKKEYATWISSAKQAGTRANRAAKAIDMLIEGKKRLR